MSKKKPPKTTGYKWLELSFIAFNGTHYGDRTDPKSFVESYIRYKTYKKDIEAVKLANSFYQTLLILAESLLKNSGGPSVPMSKKAIKFHNEQKLL